MGDWLNKLWHIYTMEYYSAIKGVNYNTDNNMDESQGHYAEWKKLDWKATPERRQVSGHYLTVCRGGWLEGGARRNFGG